MENGYTLQKTSKFIPWIMSLLICIPIYLIPESKASTFFQTETPFGTITPDKLIVVLFIVGSLYILLFRKKFQLSIPLFIVGVYFFLVLTTSISSLFGLSFLMINSLVFRTIMNFGVFLAAYIFCVYYENFKDNYKKFVIQFGFINSVFAVIQYYIGDPLFIGKYISIERGFYFMGERVTRVWGFQGEPLAVGTVTMVSIILLVDTLIDPSNKQRKRKVFTYFILAIMLAALFLTFSRGSILALIAGIFVLLRKRDFKILTQKRILLSFILVPVLIIAVENSSLSGLILNRFGQLSGGDASWTHRWSVITSFNETLGKLGLPVILGLSPGGSIAIRDYIGVLDNGYLAVFFEDGIFGMVLFISLAVFVMKGKYEVGLQSVLLAILVNMITYEMMYYSTIGCLYWSVLGILAADQVVQKKKVKMQNEKSNQIVQQTKTG